jgi:hypothetical protein
MGFQQSEQSLQLATATEASPNHMSSYIDVHGASSLAIETKTFVQASPEIEFVSITACGLKSLQQWIAEIDASIHTIPAGGKMRGSARNLA